MISFEEAQKLIADNSPQSQEKNSVLLEALGCVNSRDIHSPLALPFYNNSAMDGFAFRSGDTLNATTEKPIRLKIKGTVKAGDTATDSLEKNEAYKIMTGAVIPDGADTVLAQENATILKDTLLLNKPVPQGQHIRLKGEEIKEGELVLRKGSVINPGSIGFLAMMGMKNITVYEKPRISLIATGSELVAPGVLLRPGKIYDSNTSMIQAALDNMRIRPTFVRRTDDDFKTIKKIINFSLKASDILILTGGVSTGDYDHVKTLLAETGVKTIFWKVSQKPGKPLYFGKKGSTLVFGLPGNPAAVFTCFYEYVYPAIRRFMGFQEPFLDCESLPAAESISSDPEKSLFLKAKTTLVNGKSTVQTLMRQSSHMISSLHETNAILLVPPQKPVEKGEKALVHFLPYEVGVPL